MENEDAAAKTFHWADYLVFSLSMLLSAGIGVFYGILDYLRKKKKAKNPKIEETEESDLTHQLLGGRNMRPLPVAMSQLASFLSAPFMLGNPSEIYMFGTMYSAILVAYPLAAIVTALLYVPVFHRQEMASSYEFIERRFNKRVRLICSFMFTVGMTMLMGVAIYAPASAFSQVTGLSSVWSILGVGVICTFYTAMGGMKAVIWTDVIQMVIMLAGLVALTVQGIIDIGGFSTTWNRFVEGGRLKFNEVSLDPTVRHSWWTQVVGGFFLAMTITATNQTMIQRYLCIRTKRDAQKSVAYACLLLELYLVFVFFLGVVMFAYYYGCDPLRSGKIQTKSQLVPIFVMDCLGDWVGLPGLFTAAVFSATCSTVSSGVNSLSAVVIHDFVHPVFERMKRVKMSDKASGILSKLLALGFGMGTMGLAFVAPYMGSTLIQLGNSLLGLMGGPLLGLFTMAIFFPCANSWGAAAGTLISLLMTAWIAIGTFTFPNIPTPLELRTDMCSPNTTSVVYTEPESQTFFSYQAEESGPSIRDLYKVSYMWYSVISAIVCLVIGLLVSLATGGSRGRTLDPSQSFPYVKNCGPCCAPCCGFEICGTTKDDEKLDHDVKGQTPSLIDSKGPNNGTQEQLSNKPSYPEDEQLQHNVYTISNGLQSDQPRDLRMRTQDNPEVRVLDPRTKPEVEVTGVANAAFVGDDDVMNDVRKRSHEIPSSVSRMTEDRDTVLINPSWDYNSNSNGRDADLETEEIMRTWL